VLISKHTADALKKDAVSKDGADSAISRGADECVLALKIKERWQQC
jgi:hypothetical protein